MFDLAVNGSSLYTYVGNDPLNRIDPNGTGPFSSAPAGSLFLGGSTSGGGFFTGSFSGGLIADNEGNIGFSFSFGGGRQAGIGAKVTGTLNITQGNIYNTRGFGHQIGGTLGEGVVGGADVILNSKGKPYGVSFNAGGGVEGTGGEVHGADTYTAVAGVNIFAFAHAMGGLANFQDPFATYYSYGQPQATRRCP